MARTAKKPIVLPAGVNVSFESGVLMIKGPKGEVRRQIPSEISPILDAGAHTVTFAVARETKESNTLLGTVNALAAAMVRGASEGFVKILELEGVGYRVAMDGTDLLLSLGFSHPVKFEVPKEISIKLEKNNIEISGADKEIVGQVAAKIRDLKKPEPYKGKGIHNRGEYIRRKAGKKAGAGS